MKLTVDLLNRFSTRAKYGKHFIDKNKEDIITKPQDVCCVRSFCQVSGKDVEIAEGMKQKLLTMLSWLISSAINSTISDF